MRTKLPKSWLMLLMAYQLLSTPILGQTMHEMDSLKTVLKTAEDTTQINTLLRICRVFTQYRLHDSIDVYLDKAIDLAKEGGYEHQEYAAIDMKAILQTSRKQYAESIENHKKVIEAWEKQGNERGLSITYNNLGRTYHLIQAYDKAQDYFLKSLRLAEKLGDQEGISLSYQNLAMILALLEEHEKAIDYRHKVVAYGKKANDPFSQGVAYHGMGLSFKALEQFDSAFHYMHLSKEIARKIKHQRLEASALQILAYASTNLKQYEQANQFLDEAIGLIDPNNYYSLSYQYNYEAAALFGLKQYNAAMDAAKTALIYAEKDSSKTLLNNAYLQLYKFNKEIGNMPLALEYHEKYKDMQDSILNKERVEQIQNLNIQYESEKKQAQILSLEQESQIQELKLKQRNMLLGFLLIGTLLGLGMLYFFSRQRILREEFKRLQTEQKLLRTQMNPHFFFHALSSIQQYLLSENDRKKSVSYLSKFSRLMRNVLDSSRTESISLEEEIQTLENYIALQQLRYDQAFQYEIHVDDALQEESVNVPPLLLQPIIENAIEHGLVPKGKDGHLSVDFIKKQDTLQITIADDGVGRTEQNSSEDRKSVALTVVQNRLQLMARNKIKGAQMEVVDLKDQSGQPSGTKVIFSLPLEVAI
jgi:tetratricopeptide (TPR) repeat protein